MDEEQMPYDPQYPPYMHSISSPISNFQKLVSLETVRANKLLEEFSRGRLRILIAENQNRPLQCYAIGTEHAGRDRKKILESEISRDNEKNNNLKSALGGLK